MVTTEKKMVEELQSLAATLAAALNDINSEAHNAASDAFAKIDEFNRAAQVLKTATCYFNRKT